MRKSLFKILAVFMAVVMATSMSLQVFAAGRRTYISDIMIASADSVAAATKLLQKQGYDRVIKSDVNEGNGKVVCIGYKVTANADEAITDIAVMNMKGGYSFEDYNHVLEEYRETADKLVGELYVAVSEYRENYKAGKYGALIAHNLLNRFYDEDFGTENNLLGDILADEATTQEQLEVIFMQATTLAVTAIESCLAVGCSDNWIDRLVNMPSDTSYTTEDDDNARTIYKSFAYFQEQMNSYAEIIDSADVTMDGSEEQWQTFFDSLTEDEQNIVANFANTYDYLRATEYKDGTLYDFFMQDLNEIDNSDLYPLAKAMTAGQIATVNYASLCTSIQYATFNDDIMEGMLIGVEDEENVEIVSVFEGVDRSIFTADGIALTNEAMRQATSSSDYSWWKGNLSKKTENIFYGIMGSAAAIGALGIAAIAVTSAKVSAIVTATYQASFACIQFTNAGIPALTGALQLNQFGSWVKAVQPLKILKETSIAEARTLADTAGSNSVWSTAAGAAKIVTAVAIAVVLITLVIYLVMEYKAYNKSTTYTDIPRIIVDQTVSEDGNREYTYYYAVKDTNGDYADLNNWEGKEWNALYYTKDSNAGSPILGATSALVQSTNVASDSQYNLPVHAFGSTAAYNVNKYSKYGDPIYIFFKNYPSASAAGTAVSYGSYGLAGVAGIAIGGAGMYLIDRYLLKKKKDITAEA